MKIKIGVTLSQSADAKVKKGDKIKLFNKSVEDLAEMFALDDSYEEEYNEEYNDVVFWRISWENKNHLLL